MVKNLRSGPKWIPALIVERLGPLSYLIETADKELWRRHIDMIKECTTTTNSTTPQQGTDYGDSVPTESNCGFESPASGVTSETSTSTSETSETEVPAVVTHAPGVTPRDSIESSEVTETTGTHSRYPARTRHPPNYYRPDST